MKNPLLLASLILLGQSMFAQILTPRDIFELEYAADPQISPDGSQIVYVRRSLDIMKDRTNSRLWLLSTDGNYHRPLTQGNGQESSPRWSPDGSKLLYTSSESGSSEIHLMYMDSGQEVKLSHLEQSPRGISWSPDGKWIAFGMFVPGKTKPFIQMPQKPKGAKWAEPAKYIDELTYRADGRGYIPKGWTHIFLLPAEGGTARQITSGEINYGSNFDWSKDGSSLFVSANLHPEGEYEPRNSEIYKVSVSTGETVGLTERFGPDRSPKVSPDGKYIAYLSYEDKRLGSQNSYVHIMNVDGTKQKSLTGKLDRSAGGISWSGDSKGLYFQYDDKGNTKIAHVDLRGKITDLAKNLGGNSLGRPYAGGSFSVNGKGDIAYTYSEPAYPSDVAVVSAGMPSARKLTQLNSDLLGHKTLGAVEEIWYKSSYDQKDIQGWIALPPNFDPSQKYPLILEIHGGPFSNYGDRFSAEVQLYAAAGYVVLYTNPRGSTSYGEDFANEIHHNYPSQDYDDLISGVDAVIKKGYVDEERLYVTGGSGGGVLTAWIVGKTDRFKAAVVAKPVINWLSFSLTSDGYASYYKYWFPGVPWENVDHYWKRSPLSLVGNVTTPTMLLTGEADLRTPIPESEQFYQALKIKKVETAMVRIPGAYHGIAAKPSNLISKVLHILAWFEKYP